MARGRSRPGERYAEDLKRVPNLTVYLHGNVSCLRLAHDARSLVRLDVATLAGNGRFQVQNGAIHSGDLMASVLNAVGALLKGGTGASGETAFSRLSGS